MSDVPPPIGGDGPSGTPPPPPGGNVPPPPPPPPPAAPPAQPPVAPPPAPPSPGGPGGFGAQPSGFSIGDAFNYGWTKFQQNLGPIIIGALIFMGIALVLNLIWYAIAGAVISVDDSGAGLFAFLMFTALFAIVAVTMQYVIQAGITRGALAITYGQKVEVQTLLATDNIAQILLGGLLLGVATGIGLMLCYIPGLVVMFFGQFFVHFAIDKRLPAVDAIKASVAFVNANLGTLIGFYIASAIAVFVGALLCGIGLLAAIPVVVIAQAYTYRTLQGEPVAA